MKLADMQVTQFCDVLASDAPAPGGGSTAALEGALGAALTAMVCGLTTVGKSKEKYAEYQEFVLASQKKALDLKARFVDVMDRDTEAFNVVSAAFGMPKATDEEKAARSAAIQKGLEGCTRTPFEMMELAAGGSCQWAAPVSAPQDYPTLTLALYCAEGDLTLPGAGARAAAGELLLCERADASLLRLESQAGAAVMAAVIYTR